MITMSIQITVYYSPFCPYCTMAFRLLDQLGLKYEGINLLDFPEKRSEMEEKSQRSSVPQIFFDDYHIGGYDDMNAMHQSGELQKLINNSKELSRV